MPVDHERVDKIAAAVADVYRQGETAVLRDLTGRLARDLDATDWQRRKLAEITPLRAAARAIATRVRATGAHEARDAVAAGYRAGRHDAVRELAAAHSPVNPAPAAAGGAAARRRGNAVQALADAAVREQRPVAAAILPQAESAYRRAITNAAARKTSGATTMREAAQGAWSELVTRGVTGVTDRSGRRWRLHTFVEMATRTAVARAAEVGLVDEFQAAGVALVSVDDLPGECAMCRPYEHRVLALDPAGPTGRVRVPHARNPDELVDVDVAATLAEARAAGYGHPNCRHTLRAYHPGVSLLIKQGRTADPAGDDARQRQRYIERQLRRWREAELAAITTTARADAAARVAAWDAEMGAHITSTKLTRLAYREQIGAGFIPPHGAAAAAAKAAGVLN